MNEENNKKGVFLFIDLYVEFLLQSSIYRTSGPYKIGDKSDQDKLN